MRLVTVGVVKGNLWTGAFPSGGMHRTRRFQHETCRRLPNTFPAARVLSYVKLLMP